MLVETDRFGAASVVARRAPPRGEASLGRAIAGRRAGRSAWTDAFEPTEREKEKERFGPPRLQDNTFDDTCCYQCQYYFTAILFQQNRSVVSMLGICRFGVGKVHKPIFRDGAPHLRFSEKQGTGECKLGGDMLIAGLEKR